MSERSDALAIIGIGCRFPGASTPEAFWRLLDEGREAIAEVPLVRHGLAAPFDPQPGVPGKTYTRWAGLIDGIDRFDAAFFGIAPREADGMDPQQRLLLEVAWEALEAAGESRERLAGSATGVFVGISTFDYSRIQPSGPDTVDAYSGTGNALSIAANRLSYVLDLRGPSVAVDTACSSSLVALHLARQSLLGGECERALVGGVNLLLAPELMVAFSAARMMAADGRCKTFDARADGYVRGEGCGVVVLKRLDDALAAGDPVIAVVRGSAVNQDGRSNGLTAPNGPAQAAVIRAALAAAGETADALGYVEAHGTGTRLGDPIEALALAEALEGRAVPGPVGVGSVKTNIGHLEAAAGIAGVIKTALALKHRRLPASLNYSQANPDIPFDDIGLRVVAEGQDWPTDRRLAGVSSFGFGGTNAHVLLGPPPAMPDARPALAATERLLVLSAAEPAALNTLAARVAAQLVGLGDDARRFADLCWTAAQRRTHHDHRLALAAGSAAQAADALRAFAAGEPVAGLVTGQRPPRPKRGTLSAAAPLADIAQGYVAGQRVDWAGVFPDDSRIVPLPAYPWQHRRHWFAPAATEPAPADLEALCYDMAWVPVGPVAVPALAARLATAGERLHDAAHEAEMSAVEAALDRLCAGFARNAVAQVGEHEVMAAHRRLFARLQDMACDSDAARDPQAFAADVQARFPGHRGGIALVAECGAALPAVLTGARDPLAILFPDGGGGRLAALYRDSAAMRQANTLAGEAVAAVVAALPADRTLRVLEIGAGTGGTTDHLLGRLPDGRVRYVFTDLAPPLLAQAATRYTDRPWLSTALLDIERDPAGQGVPAGGFDLVVAANVLHATADLAVTLANVARLLAPGGRLLLLEQTAPRRWLDLVFGLTEGWWRFADSGCRPDYPLLTPERWGRLLNESGFTIEASQPCDAAAAQTIIVASPHAGAALVPGIAELHSAAGHGPAGRHTGSERTEGDSSAEASALAGFQPAAEYNSALPGGGVADDAVPAESAGLVPGITGLQPVAGRSPADLHAGSDGAVGDSSAEASVTAGFQPAAEYNSALPGEDAPGLSAPPAGLQPAAECNSALPGALGRWLVVDGRSGAGAGLAGAWDARVLRATDDPEDAEAQVRTALADQTFAGLLCLAPMDGGETGLRRTLAALRGLAACGVSLPVWIVTCHGQTLAADDTPADPWQAAAWGLARSFAAERPDCAGGVIDVDGPALSRLLPWLAQTAERQLVLRDGRVLAPRLRRLSPPSDRHLPVSPEGRYLILGGGGALGRAVAAWLVERGARHLILAGRRPIPAEVIALLTAGGATVDTRQVDLADTAAVTALITELANGGLNGLVHTAGAFDNAPLAELSWAASAPLLAAKLQGTQALLQATDGLPLDFLVFFSSAAATLGLAKAANYAAANAGLEAVVARARRDGRPALAIGWGPWTGLGMAERADAQRWAGVGLAGLPRGQALAAMDRLATGPSACPLVLAADWPVLAEVVAFRDAPAWIGEVAARSTNPPSDSDDGAPDLRRRLAGAFPAERRGVAQAFVQSQVAAVLRLPADRLPPAERGLQDLGLDSLSALDLRDRLQRGSGLALPATLAIEHPTIAALADALLGRLEAAPAAQPAVTASPGGDVARQLPLPASGQEPAPRPASLPAAAKEPIAIVGLSCRFPGGETPEAFWSLLADGRDAVGPIPRDRWDVARFHGAGGPGRSRAAQGAFLDDVRGFDAPLFHLSGREADALDPQQRLLLEVAWEALERSGLSPDALKGSRTGVFVGLTSHDYGDRQIASGDPTRVDAYFGSGNTACFAPGRLSYLLGLSGPSLAVDTACSASLVALHQACQSLRSGESERALVGGVHLMLSPGGYLYNDITGALAPDGRSKTFDAAADGFGRGEGCAVLVLRRLSDALAAGEHIHALIRGSAVNQDGASGGLTVPSGAAQQAVIRAALADAALAPGDIDYVEAHGTGTALGDPIELNALGAVFAGRPAQRPLVVGSVKTNLGHLEAAAGLAGLVKTVLALQHGKVPAHLNLHTPNPHVPWSSLPLRVATGTEDWPMSAAAERPLSPTPLPRGERGSAFDPRGAFAAQAGVSPGVSASVPVESPADGDAPPPSPLAGEGLGERGPRRAGVSAFSLMGTNAHVVLEQAPSLPPTAGVDRSHHPFVLSARSPAALQRLAGAIANGLSDDESLGDRCFSNNAGRAQHACRLATVVENAPQLRQRLAAVARGERPAGTAESRVSGHAAPPVAFLFTGQGAVGPDMGRGLYETSPVFAAEIDRCAAILAPHLDVPLLDLLYGAESARLARTRYAQPALAAVEWSLATLWRGWGVEPAAVLGHSLGEYVAAAVAGMIDIEALLPLVAERGRLMDALPEGVMLSVNADADTAAAAIGDLAARVSVAVLNAPGSTVIAGDRAAVDVVAQRLTARGLRTRPLAVSHAFHSPMMGSILDELTALAAAAPWRPGALPLARNLDGRLLAAGEVPPPHDWARHAREAVRFFPALQALAGRGITHFIEIGPRPVLTALGPACLADGQFFATLNTGEPDWPRMLESLTALWLAGQPVDWAAFERPYGRRRLWQPGYPFERRDHWIEEPDMSEHRTAGPMDAAPGPISPDIPVADVEAMVALVAEALKSDPADIDPDAPLLELGADSISLVDVGRLVKARYGLVLSAKQFFEELTSVRALAAYVGRAAPVSPTAVSPAVAEAQGRVAADRGPSGARLPSATRRSQGEDAVGESGAVTGTPADAGDLGGLFTRQLDLVQQVIAQQIAALAARGLPTASQDASPYRTTAGPVQSPESTGSDSTVPSARPEEPAGEAPSRRAVPPRDLGPHRPPRRQDASAVGDPRRQAHLDALVARYTARTPTSKRLAEAARPRLADSRASAGFRPSVKEMLYPLVGDKADGARLWDVDGNAYIDISMDFGVNLFGHRAPFLMQAMRSAIDRGLAMAPRSPDAAAAAALVCELTGMDRVVFCQSGSESVMTAVRLARLAKGRDGIALFRNSYHGHSDGLLAVGEGGGFDAEPVAGGIPSAMVRDILVLDYADPASFEILRRHAHRLAAVLVEPVQSRALHVQPGDYLKQLRALTRELDLLLIFDEMITGFRLHPGGAQAWFGVEADLATYGKAMGGGVEVAAIAGRGSVLDGIDGGLWRYGDASYPAGEVTFFAGTFNANPLAMAATRAALTEMKRRGPDLQAGINALTLRFASDLNSWLTGEGVPLEIVTCGSLFRFTHKGNLDLLFYHLLEKGVFVWEGRNCFLSAAHTEADMAAVAEAVRQSVRELRAGGYIDDPGITGLQPVAGRSSAALHPGASGDYRESGVEPPGIAELYSAAGHSPAQRHIGIRDEAGGSSTEAAVPAGFQPAAEYNSAIPGAMIPGAPIPGGGTTSVATLTLPLTPAQQQLWLLAEVDDTASLAYTECLALQIDGHLDPDALDAALRRLVSRHQALRTAIAADGRTQDILDTAPIALVRAGGEDRDAWLAAFLARPFDLSAPPLLRVGLLEEGPHGQVLALAAHHIVVDGWSMALLVNDLVTCYRTEVEGGGPPEAPLCQLGDLVRYQQTALDGARRAVLETYWRDALTPLPAALALPTDRRPVPGARRHGGRHRFTLDGELRQRLQRLGRSAKATPFAALLAAVSAFLHRLTGQDDLLIGVPVLGRGHDADLMEAVGYATHLIPVRSRCDFAGSFAEHLARSRTALVEALDHQDYPYAEVLRLLGLAWNAGRQPLLEVTFNLDRPSPPAAIPGVTAQLLPSPMQAAKFPLCINALDVDGALTVDLDYDADLFSKAAIDRLASQLREWLRVSVEQPETPLAALSPVGEDERRLLLQTWNDTACDWPADRGLVHEMIEAQAARDPEALALTFAGRTMTYGRLLAESGQLAQRLAALGAGPETTVACLFDRSFDMVVALLAVMRTGAAYLPIALDEAPTRLAGVLADAGPVAALTRAGLASPLHAALAEGRELLAIGPIDPAAPAPDVPADLALPRAEGETPAYLLFTSGSTGRPKGVVSVHKGLRNRLLWMQQAFPIGPGKSVLQKTPYTFDVSVWEFFWPLTVGARLVIAEPDLHRDPQAIARLIRDEAVNVCHFVPSMLALFVEEPDAMACAALERVMCSGEAMPRDLVGRFHTLGLSAELHNLYGPTEAAIDVTHWPCADTRADPVVPIGRPIANTLVRILDDRGELAPVGAVGEIHLGGVQLARGYLNRPELTDKAFIPDPFAAGGRLYRTGDLGRWRADGSIVYLGRRDTQVKLRGQRIELGEIETALRAHPEVRDAVAAVVGDDPVDRRLAAWIVPVDTDNMPPLASDGTAPIVIGTRIGGGAVPEATTQPPSPLAGEGLGERGHRPATTASTATPFHLPGGIPIEAINRAETVFMAQEHFLDRTYFRHGIGLPEDALVLDVGANIGVFALSVAASLSAARVHAFEPIPSVHAVLARNAARAGGRIVTHALALGEADGEAAFTWYPHVSILSGPSADSDEDAGVVRAFLRQSADTADIDDALLDELVAGRLAAERVTVPTRRLSSLIDTLDLARIDLLKIDVEKAEWAVLQGIDEADWGKIRQVVVEVHDIAGRLAAIRDRLEALGFQVAAEQERWLAGTAIHCLYAYRPDDMLPPVPAPNAENLPGIAELHSAAGRSPARLHVGTWDEAGGSSAEASVPAGFPPTAEYNSAIPGAPQPGATGLPSTLRAYLATRLPIHMVPDLVTLVPALPLTTHGKIDRKALTLPDIGPQDSSPSQPPETDLQRQLLDLWREQLGPLEIGIHDDFFRLGGHSLMAVRLVATTRERFAVDLPVKAFLETPTIAAMAARITEAGQVHTPREAPIRRADRSGRRLDRAALGLVGSRDDEPVR